MTIYFIITGKLIQWFTNIKPGTETRFSYFFNLTISVTWAYLLYNLRSIFKLEMINFRIMLFRWTPQISKHWIIFFTASQIEFFLAVLVENFMCYKLTKTLFSCKWFAPTYSLKRHSFFAGRINDFVNTIYVFDFNLFQSWILLVNRNSLLSITRFIKISVGWYILLSQTLCPSYEFSIPLKDRLV